MTFSVNKPDTWKGLSYVLKSSRLKDAIVDAGLDCYVNLRFWTPQQDHKKDCSLIQAEYWLPNPYVHHTRFYIRTGVVPSMERKAAEAVMMAEVIPQLVDWMGKQLAEPLNSRQRPGMFCAYWRDGKLVID